jgi:hypothetical protein
MKLYTEEQVRLLLDLSKLKVNGEMYSKDVLLEQVAPIELPSDEEIAYKLKEVIGNIGELEHRKLTFIGALWMKEQILNQNK